MPNNYLKEEINMLLDPQVEEALITASILHRHQVRKDADVPYIIHPVAVAFIASRFTRDKNIIMAALLHDTLEDVKDYTYDALAREFGDKVAGIVREVTEDRTFSLTRVEEKNTWLRRKNNYLQQLKNGSREALMVAAADKIHNLHSMIKSYRCHGDELWADFNAPEPKVKSYLWFFNEVAGVLRQHLKSDIVSELVKLCDKAADVFPLPAKE